MTIVNEKLLVDVGLTAEQTRAYLSLIQDGLSPAAHVSKKTGLGRALIYKVLGQLIALGLAEKKKTSGKVSFFAPTHPNRLKELLAEKKKGLEQTAFALQSEFGSLTSAFNLLQGKPNVQFFEGVNGLRHVYNDILDVGQDILVISAPIDEGRKEVLHLIREQIEKQAAKKIRTKTINPTGDYEPATQIFEDEKYLITRKKVPAEKLPLPAQIIVYGDKVAITNFKEGLITVLIESKYIAETFRTLFEYVWEKS